MHLFMFWNIDNIDLSMSVVFILKFILGRIIFVSGGSEERRKYALNVVNFSILS